MFFEILTFARILIKFDQNPANHIKEIARTTAVGKTRDLDHL
jgi:hypothetical protein